MLQNARLGKLVCVIILLTGFSNNGENLYSRSGVYIGFYFFIWLL